MKRLVRIGLMVSILGASLACLAIPSVSAQVVLTDAQRTLITDNCVTIKNSLNQLHATDALLRVNRGQLYESLNSHLMNNFNTRLNNNDRDTQGLEAITKSYRAALTQFRENYATYERQLSTTLAVDCTEKPDEFHGALLGARDKRTVVRKDVINLHRYIDDYRAAINDFILNDPVLSEEIKV